MKELTNLQQQMINTWLKKAEKTEFKASEIQSLDDKISAIINSIEYESPISYFPRLIK